jgi:hypothetical protein
MHVLCNVPITEEGVAMVSRGSWGVTVGEIKGCGPERGKGIMGVLKVSERKG